MSTPDLRDDRGFTFIELLVAIVLIGVIGGVVTTSVVRGMQTAQAATARVDVLTAVERVQERMGRQIRFADRVIAATPTTLTFENRDATRRYRRTYTHDTSARTLRETVATYSTPTAAAPSSTVTTTIARNVDTGGAAVFTYFDAANAPWAPATNVRLRRVAVTLGHPIAGGPPLIITTSVSLRNTSTGGP